MKHLTSLFGIRIKLAWIQYVKKLISDLTCNIMTNLGLLNLKHQGHVHMQISREGEKDDIWFHFGKAFRSLKWACDDMFRVIVDSHYYYYYYYYFCCYCLLINYIIVYYYCFFLLIKRKQMLRLKLEFIHYLIIWISIWKHSLDHWTQMFSS